MAMNKATVITAAMDAFKIAMQGQYGGDLSDYDDIAANMVAPVVDAIIQHILDNAETDTALAGSAIL